MLVVIDTQSKDKDSLAVVVAQNECGLHRSLIDHSFAQFPVLFWL